MPLLKLFKKLGISPNTITFSSILLSFLLSYFLWNAFENSLYFLFVAFGLLFRMMLNALDGMMARSYNLQSKKGEVLNEVGDIISDTAIYFPLILFESINRRYDGPMGKSDRAFLIGLICIIYYFTNKIDPYLNTIIFVASILMIISSYLRLTKSITNE